MIAESHLEQNPVMFSDEVEIVFAEHVTVIYSKV